MRRRIRGRAARRCATRSPSSSSPTPRERQAISGSPCDGAADGDQARVAARVVAQSPLVKTAIHGGDPNWGRIVAALGRSGATFTLDRCRVAIGGIVVFDRGAPEPVDAERIRVALSHPRLDIVIDLGAGDGAGHAWGCDLSADYVRINADYTT